MNLKNSAIAKKRKLSLAAKRNIAGYVFTLPFTLGFVFLFLSSMILYIKMSFSDFSPTAAGMRFDSAGLRNFHEILFVRNGFLKNTFASLGKMLVICPAVLLFSFFIANILNQKFRGRTFYRTMFFLPFVCTAGMAPLLPSIFGLSGPSGMLTDSSSHVLINEFMKLLGFSAGDSIWQYFDTIVSQLYSIVSSSAMQILIFLAGLQSISPSLYEASAIEGCTAWENFWKITLPMISPLILVNAAYTLIDSLAGVSNTMIKEIYEVTMTEIQFGIGSAMGVLYLLIVLLCLGVLMLIVNQFVFYEDR